MYNYRILKKKETPWEVIGSCYDHTVFKSKEWTDFLLATQGVQPFIVEIAESEQVIGYFIGEKFSRLFSIVASPFEGWTTSYQGLSLLIPVSANTRLKIYKALIDYLFKNRICSFFQASDWQLSMDGLASNGVKYEVVKGYKLNLTQSEEQIYKNFSSSSCQYAIRKSQKNGVIIREAKEKDQFIQHYNKQLTEVFEKQQLNPTYDATRVSALIDKLQYSGKLLLLEAVSADGTCIATGIFVGDNKLAYFWGGASYTKYQSLCPNEPIIFEAIKYWKKRGCTDFDLGGIRKYKEKYGPEYFEKPKIVASKYKWLLRFKGFAKSTYYNYRYFKAHVRSLFSKRSQIYIF